MGKSVCRGKEFYLKELAKIVQLLQRNSERCQDPRWEVSVFLDTLMKSYRQLNPLSNSGAPPPAYQCIKGQSTRLIREALKNMTENCSDRKALAGMVERGRNLLRCLSDCRYVPPSEGGGDVRNAAGCARAKK